MDDSKGKEIRSVTIVGLIVNLVLSIIKFVAGFFGHSRAVIADAVHSLSDCTTDMAVLIGSHYWLSPPDDDHQYGHGRIETIVTLFIGLVLLAAGIGLGWNSVSNIHEKHSSTPGWIAVLAAAISIITKEILYRWTIKAGRRLKSSSLSANAWHHRSDALSSIPTLLAVTGSILLPSWSFLDHMGAIIVSIFIIQAAIKIIWPGLKEFIDAAAPPEVCDEIISTCMGFEEVRQVHKLRTRYVGVGIQVDIHIEVDGNLTITEGHAISGKVKYKVLENVSDVMDVLIHIEPASPE